MADNSPGQLVALIRLQNRSWTRVRFWRGLCGWPNWIRLFYRGYSEGIGAAPVGRRCVDEVRRVARQVAIRRPDEAIVQFRKTLEIDPRYTITSDLQSAVHV
jgi:hypothetical protein